MSTSLEKIKSAKYLATDGTNIYTSDDLATFTDLKTLNNGNYTDIQTIKIGDWYYLIGTLCFFKTQDFTTFTNIDISLINNSSYTDISHLRLFEDADNKYHISYKATNDNNTTFIYIADFNAVDDTVSNAYQKVTVSDSNCNACFIYTFNKYYLFLDDTDIYVSDNYLNNFTELATNISNNSSNTYTDSYVFMDANYVYLTQVVNSNTVTYRRASRYNLIIWSNEATLTGLTSSMGIYYNGTNTTAYVELVELENTFDPIVTVQALHVEQKAILTCFIWTSFEVQWSENSSWQITFTAYDDGTPSYDMLTSEASIFFNGQEFIIKSCETDYAKGVETKTITATHVYNELQYIRQRSSTSDTATYTMKEVFDYYFNDNDDTNTRGFSYNIYGDFDSAQISSLGGNSAKDMLSTILSTWTDAIIYPDNKQINVYTPTAFEKSYGRRIDYLNNAQEVKMTVDSTNVTNKVYCIGKPETTTSDDTSTTTYYFDPFWVSDEDSISNWKLKTMATINDDTYTDASLMKEYALSQLQPDPAISVEITDTTNDVPLAGEVRHLKVKEDYEQDVMLIGYTWYPFSKANNTVLEFDNLPASILNTQAILANRLTSIKEMLQQATNKANASANNYISDTDPSKYINLNVGDIWTRKLTE